MNARNESEQFVRIEATISAGELGSFNLGKRVEVWFGAENQRILTSLAGHVTRVSRLFDAANMQSHLVRLEIEVPMAEISREADSMDEERSRPALGPMIIPQRRKAVLGHLV